MTATLRFIGEIGVYFLTVLSIILSLRGNYLLYKVKNAMFVQKRNPLILFGINVSLMTAILLGAIITAARIYDILLLVLIGNVWGVLCYYSILFHAITRQWMVFYIGKWSFYTKQAKWKDIITNSKDNNWYVRNKSRWGSLKFVFIVFGVYHLFGIILGIIAVVGHALQFLPPLATTALTTVPFLLSIALYIGILCATRPVEEEDDIFFISWESKWISRLLLSMLLFVIINSIVIEIFDPVVIALVFFPIWIINTYAIHHVSTYSIYLKNIASIARDCDDGFAGYMPSHHINVTETGNKCEEEEVEITLPRVLSNTESMNLFMFHLGNEYSMELLLSLIEIEQYQQYVLHNMDTRPHIELDKYNEILLPKHVPISGIIIDSNDTPNMKAYKIYKKYMVSGCDLQINISFRMKQNLLILFHILEDLETMEINDIFMVFEQVKKEMYNLMRFSFGRLKTGKDYQKMKLIFQKYRGFG